NGRSGRSSRSRPERNWRYSGSLPSRRIDGGEGGRYHSAMPSYQRRVAIPGKSAQELYDVIAKDIDRVMTKASIGEFQIQRDAASKSIDIKSKMFSAKLLCQEGAVSLDGQLSFLAAPFKSKIDEGINRWLSKTFNLQGS